MAKGRARGRKFADGGKVEKPTYWQAVKDRVKELLPKDGAKLLGTGMAKRDADSLKNQDKTIDKAVDEASMARGGSVKKRKRPSGGISPAMLAAMAGPAGGQGGPMAAGPGGPPGMPPGMKRGGAVKKNLTSTKTENKGGASKIGGGVEKKGKTSTSFIAAKGSGMASKGKTPTRNYASGGSVRGHGIESSGKTRGRFT